MQLTDEQMKRAAAALGPYIAAWELPLNPEHLYQLAGAVLTHFDSYGDRAGRWKAPMSYGSPTTEADASDSRYESVG
jgi:hypothetical protein